MSREALSERTEGTQDRAVTAMLWLSLALLALCMIPSWPLSSTGTPREILVLLPGCGVLGLALAGPRRWRLVGLFVGMQVSSLGAAFYSGFLLPNPWVMAFASCALAALVLPARGAWLLWSGGLLLWIACAVWFVTIAPLPAGTFYDVHRADNWLRVTLVYGAFSAGLMGVVALLVTRMEQAITDNEQMLQQLARETDRRAQASQQERRLEAQLHQSQKLAAIGTLAGGIAHDFSQLLAIMAEASERIARAAESPAQTQAAEAVKSAADSGTTLAQQLVSFNERQALVKVPIDVAASVHATVPIVSRLLPTSISLEVFCDDALPPVCGPDAAIEQIVLNLCVNARDALPEGGTIIVEAHTQQGHVRVRVRDNGVGMDAATCARVFDRFFTTKEAGKGTGLGLATVHALATACGGEVTVDSAIGAGTTFEVVLPARHELQLAAAARAQPTLILVVENDPHQRDFLLSTLERAGHTVVRALGGAHAEQIIAARSGELGLVLTSPSGSILVPGARYEAMRRASPQLPWLICAASRDGVPDVVLTSPQTAFLAQPVSGHELLGAVAALLSCSTHVDTPPTAVVP